MKIVGLTGSIGMGKSATAGMLKHLGIPVHDSDAAVHAALAPGGSAYREVISAFPESLDKKSGFIDRAKLGKIVFANETKRKQLESIIHPHVWSSQRRFIRQAKKMKARIAVLDIPLLYETGAEAKCDIVICVTAPPFLQKQRVLRRAGMTEERFRLISKSQMPDNEKRKRADFVIDTGLGRAHTLREIKKILKVIA